MNSGSSGRRGASSGRCWTTCHSASTSRASRLPLPNLGAEYGYFPDSIKPYLRLPSGHPEGFHEALANLHKTIQLAILKREGESVPAPYAHPGVEDGAAGMAFIEAAVKSSASNGAWTDVTPVG